MNKPPYLVFLAMFLTGLVLIVFVVILWFYVIPLSGNKILVEDQVFTDKILVKRVSVRPTPAILVIQLENEYRLPGIAYGEATLPVPDDYRDIALSVRERSFLSGEDVGRLRNGLVAYATLYKDINNTGGFEDNVDVPIRDIWGKPVQVKFNLKLDS